LVQYLTGWQQIFAYVKKYYLEDATGTYINRNHFDGLVGNGAAVYGTLVCTWPQTCAVQLSERSKGAQPLIRSGTASPGLFALSGRRHFTALIFSRSRMGFFPPRLRSWPF